MFGIKLLTNKNYSALQETLSTYQRTLEDIAWVNLSLDNSSQTTFLTKPFMEVLKEAKIMYYNNPLAGLWIDMTTQFVFGEGVSNPKAADDTIQEIVDTFWDDPDNKLAVTGYLAQQKLSNKLQYEGNLFFVLFDDEVGDVKVRVLNSEEVVDIIYDEDDRMRPLFYKVAVKQKKYDYTSDSFKMIETKVQYYPDISNFNPQRAGVPSSKLVTDAKIMHVKINCDINDKFGVPVLYRGVDWIRSHKNMAGDVATLVKALSKFAWTKKVKGGQAKINSLKDALSSKASLRDIQNSSGQTHWENEGVEMKAVDVKTGGVKIGEDGMRQMKLMVCAASGIFEHYYGDPSTGNLATAKSMELPMVKKFTMFQQLWRDIYDALIQYVIDLKISVGELDGTVEEDTKTQRIIYDTTRDRELDIDFPPILEADLKEKAEAYTKAKDGSLIGEDLAAEMFMLDANVNNVEEELEILQKEREIKKKEQEEQFERGLMLPKGAPGATNVPPTKVLKPTAKDIKKPTKKDPIKEAIEVPSKEGTRLDRKSNFMHQKINGYRKALAGHYRRLQKEIREGIRTDSKQGRTTGIVNGFDKALKNFSDSMRASAKAYFPTAIQVGEKFMQAELREVGVTVEDTLYEANGRADVILEEKLSWNEDYLLNSFVPAIRKKVEAAIKSPYETEEEFREAIAKAVGSFEGRVEMYVGALWHVEEAAVKEAGRGTGVLVNFAGFDDDENCPGCDEAMAQNPWPIDDAPIPGEQQCLGNCRHALQIVTP